MAVDDACAGGEWTCVVDRKKASDAIKIVNDLFIVRTARLALRDADRNRDLPPRGRRCDNDTAALPSLLMPSAETGCGTRVLLFWPA